MSFPIDQLDVVTELYLGPGLGWVDVSEDARVGSSGGGISYTRGRQDWGKDTDPGEGNLVLNNRHGKWSTRNPRSELFGILGRNQPVRVGVRLLVDEFDRTETSGWGTSPDTGAYLPPTAYLDPFGSDTACSVGGGLAAQTHPSDHSLLRIVHDLDFQDLEQCTDIQVPAAVTGAAAVSGHVYRLNAFNHYYWCRLEFNAGGSSVTLKITKELGDGPVTLAELVDLPGVTYSAGQPLRFRSCIAGGMLAAKVWTPDDPEPLGWQLVTTDTEIATPGLAGIQTWMIDGNTNSYPFAFEFDRHELVSRRFHAEVPAWPVEWDLSGEDRWVPVTVAGLLRRLNRGKKLVDSPLHRAILRSKPVAYWPLTDAPGSPEAASPVAGVEPMRPFGFSRFTVPGSGGKSVPAANLPVFGSGEGIPGSPPVVDLAKGGTLQARVPQVEPTGEGIETGWRIEFAMIAPRDRDESKTVIAWETNDAFLDHPSAEKQPMYWEMQIEQSGIFLTYGRNLTAYGSASASFSVFDGLPHHYRIQADTFLENVRARVYVDGVLVDTFSSFSNTMAGAAGQIQRVIVNPSEEPNGSEAMPVLGGVAVWSPIPSGETATPSAALGHPGETAGNRMFRLARERGVPLVVVGDPDATAKMGTQPAGTFIDLVWESVAADGGILVEDRTQLGLIYRTRRSLYNQKRLELSYASGHVAEPFKPIPDDQLTANDVTVTRADGGSYRAVQETGPLNVQEPGTDPDGVGRYEATPTLSLASPSQLKGAAGWLKGLGTWDEDRYPVARFDLAATGYLADRSLALQVASLAEGHTFEVGDLPEWLPPEPAALMVQGATETLDAFDWDIEVNATPARPWDVGVLGETTRLDTTGCRWVEQLAVGTDTSGLVLSTGPAGGRWIDSDNFADQFPFNIRTGGTVLEVTGVDPAARDLFGRSVAAGSWGDATTGQPWSINSGVAANWSVTGSVGRISTATVNQLELATINVGTPHANPRFTFEVPVAPSGSGISGWIITRFTDTSNYYYATVLVTSAQTVELRLLKRVGGTGTVLGTVVLAGAHTAGNSYVVQVSAIDSTLRARAWRVGQSEERGWHITATDTAITAGTRVGVGVRRETGNTNGATDIDIDEFWVPSLQVMTFEQVPVNGVERVVPAQTPLSLDRPWRLAR